MTHLKPSKMLYLTSFLYSGWKKMSWNFWQDLLAEVCMLQVLLSLWVTHTEAVGWKPVRRRYKDDRLTT